MKKAKKIIILFIRIIPLLPIIAYLLSCIQSGLPISDIFRDINENYLNDGLWYEYYNSLVISEPFSVWLYNSGIYLEANQYDIINWIILFGGYQVLVSLLVLFYNFITFVIRWASDMLEWSYEKTR